MTWYCTNYLVDDMAMVTESQLRGVMHIHRPEPFTQFVRAVGQPAQGGECVGGSGVSTGQEDNADLESQ